MNPDDVQWLDELITRARGGDDQALGQLFDHLRPLLVRIAQREIGHSTSGKLDAEDVVSDVMLRLIDHIRTDQGPVRAPVAYLARSIRNRVLDIRRSAATGREIGSDDLSILADAHVHIDDDAEQRHVDHADEIAVVRIAMGRLPQRQQLILTAVAINGMKPREISAETGIAPNTIAATASRARKALAVEVRRVLLEANEGPECRAVRDELTQASPRSDRASAHLRTCPKCRRSLARFAALPSILSLVLVAVLSNAIVQALRSGLSTRDSAKSHPSGGRTAAMAAGLLAMLMGLLVVVVLPWIFAEESSMSNTSASPSAPPLQPTPVPSGSSVGEFENPLVLDVEVTGDEANPEIRISMVLRPGAVVETLEVALPAGVQAVDTPGWACASTQADESTCLLNPATSRVPVLRLTSDAVPAQGTASVTAAVSLDGVTTTASTEGALEVR